MVKAVLIPVPAYLQSRKLKKEMNNLSLPLWISQENSLKPPLVSVELIHLHQTHLRKINMTKLKVQESQMYQTIICMKVYFQLLVDLNHQLEERVKILQRVKRWKSSNKEIWHFVSSRHTELSTQERSHLLEAEKKQWLNTWVITIMTSILKLHFTNKFHGKNS